MNRFIKLTRTQRKIAGLVGEAWTNEEIAKALGIHEQSVRNELSKVYAKWKIRNRVELALRMHKIRVRGEVRDVVTTDSGGGDVSREEGVSLLLSGPSNPGEDSGEETAEGAGDATGGLPVF